jgi:hypothetical protein
MNPRASGPSLRGYRVAQAAGEKPVLSRIYEPMLLESPVPLQAFSKARVAPALALFVSGLPASATAGLAWAAVAGVFAAVEFTQRDASPDAVLIGERLLPDGIFQEELRLDLDGRPLAAWRVAEIGGPGPLLAWLAAAVGGIEPGQIVLLGGPAGARLPGEGTLLVAGTAGSMLVARIGA